MADDAEKEPRGDPAEATDSIDGAPVPARGRLRVLAEAIRAEAPGAVKRIAHGLPTRGAVFSQESPRCTT